MKFEFVCVFENRGGYTAIKFPDVNGAYWESTSFDKGVLITEAIGYFRERLMIMERRGELFPTPHVTVEHMEKEYPRDIIVEIEAPYMWK